MMRTTLAMVLLVSAGLTGAADARDSEYKLPINEVTQNPEFKARLGDAVVFRFGNGKMPAGAQSLGEFVTNKKTNSVGKPDEEACRWAMLSALLELRERAEKEGGNAVVNIVSYYKKDTYSSPTEYECHAGGLIAGVALKGTVVKLRK
jgi:uncharacterized protein YbjQ (UPF0145 family)